MRWINLITASLLALPLGALAADAASDTVSTQKTAVFAGGCFWCMEAPFDQLEGVSKTLSGYTGGEVPNPTYEAVSAGSTGHIEAVEITYDPSKVSYQKLLEVFWANIDPVDEGGQFCDRGEVYTTAIFFADEEQKKWAEASKTKVAKRIKKPIVTPIRASEVFYPAEDYHQNFYQTNALKYKYYRWSCRRDARLKQLWGEQAGQALPLFKSQDNKPGPDNPGKD